MATLLLAVTGRLRRWAESEVDSWLDASGPTWRQLEALQIIAASKHPNPGVMASELGVTPAVVTGLISRLEARGLVARTDDPRDRRVVRLRLTVAGRDMMVMAESRLIERLSVAMRPFSSVDEQVLRDAIGVLSSDPGERCGQCKTPISANDRFCAHCGARLPDMR